VSSIVKVPREVITQRLQSGVDAKSFVKGYSPAIQTFQLIVKERGVKGLFQGFWSTTLRDWPFMVILFSTYDAFKNNHLKMQNKSGGEKDINNGSFTLYGGASGFLAGFFTAPMDIVKTRIMTGKGASRGVGAVAASIYRETGARGFFVGAGARSVWWFCVCSMFFPLYEAGKEYIGGKKIVMQQGGKLFDHADL
jgi:hypothetical protein